MSRHHHAQKNHVVPFYFWILVIHYLFKKIKYQWASQQNLLGMEVRHIQAKPKKSVLILHKLGK